MRCTSSIASSRTFILIVPALSRISPAMFAPRCEPSNHLDQTRILAEAAAGLGLRLSIHHDNVRREVVTTFVQVRADTIPLDGHPVLREQPDAIGVEAAGDHDLHVAEAFGVERVADV